MSVSVIIITHDKIGTALAQTATKVFGKLPLPTTLINIEANTDPEKLLPKLSKLVKHAGAEGILILTDLFGSTPSNIARKLKNKSNIRIISGLNLPMLIRVMNYPKASLDELAKKALTGGRKGIVEDNG